MGNGYTGSGRLATGNLQIPDIRKTQLTPNIYKLCRPSLLAALSNHFQLH